MRAIEGVVCKDRLTKKLVQRVERNHIALVKHRAIDLVAAQDLKGRNVKALVNCDDTIDVNCSLEGIRFLLDNGIKIYDIFDGEFFNNVKNGDIIRIEDNKIFVNRTFYGYCKAVKKEDVASVLDINIEQLKKIRYSFIKNTMNYMDKELDYFFEDKNLPEIHTDLRGREVIIVSRGRGYREDLRSIKEFIINKRPMIISVDGGADAVCEIGLKSDIILGDMDSISDKTLLTSGEILVHSYCNGYAPGLARVESKNLSYKLLMLKGTSEDAAIYMAALKGASLIYLIGSHTGFEEFLEKGRQGMGSTALLRILYGDKIVDLKGISNIMTSNKTRNLKASIVLIFLVFILYFFISDNIIREYMIINLKALFNIGLQH